MHYARAHKAFRASAYRTFFYFHLSTSVFLLLHFSHCHLVFYQFKPYSNNNVLNTIFRVSFDKGLSIQKIFAKEKAERVPEGTAGNNNYFSTFSTFLDFSTLRRQI
jgi:hypothetical protein